jgi:hypothetical protein
VVVVVDPLNFFLVAQNQGTWELAHLHLAIAFVTRDSS